jgi:hypothetical protein
MIDWRWRPFTAVRTCAIFAPESSFLTLMFLTILFLEFGARSETVFWQRLSVFIDCPAFALEICDHITSRESR